MSVVSIEQPASVPSHDSERWLRVAAWAAIAFGIAQVLAFSFGRDQGTYAVFAEGILEGRMPYRDLWDIKPPGIFLVYALAHALFGRSMFSIRLLEALMMLATVAACCRLGMRFYGSRTAGLLGGALACVVHAQIDFHPTGSPEVFAGALTILAILLVTEEGLPRHRLLLWGLAGALFGFCFLLKPPFAGGALACSVYLGLSARRDGRSLAAQVAPTVVMAAGSVAVIAATAAWFAARGGLEEMWWTLTSYSPGYSRLGWVGANPAYLFLKSLARTIDLSILLSFGALLLLVVRPRARREKEAAWLILGVLLFQLAGIAIQAKFFKGHFAVCVPLLALLAGQGYFKTWRRWFARGSLRTLTFVTSMAALALVHPPLQDLQGSFLERSSVRMTYLLTGGRAVSREEADRRLSCTSSYSLDEVRQVALEIERSVAPGSFIYIWGFEPLVHWLSDTRPASRFVHNVAQRSAQESEWLREQLMADLRRHPPEAIVVQRGDAWRSLTGNDLDSMATLAQFHELERFLHEGYSPGTRFEYLDIWLRRAEGEGTEPRNATISPTGPSGPMLR